MSADDRVFKVSGPVHVTGDASDGSGCLLIPVCVLLLLIASCLGGIDDRLDRIALALEAQALEQTGEGTP